MTDEEKVKALVKDAEGLILRGLAVIEMSFHINNSDEGYATKTHNHLQTALVNLWKIKSDELLKKKK